MKQELIEKYLKPKKKKLDEASASSGTGLINWTFWNRGASLIYVRNEEVLFSNTHEFPTGSPMYGEIRRDAQARGYTILDW
jgi:hypothetical protein